MSIKLAFPLLVLTDRTEPIEVDDSYVYMNQVTSNLQCNQNKHIESFKSEVFQSHSNSQVEFERFKRGNRFFHFYTPFSSSLQLLIKKLGFSSKAAYFFFVAIGTVCIAVGVCYWLFKLAGPLGAAMALLSFSFTLFKGQGLHLTVASNVAAVSSLIIASYIFHNIYLRSKKSLGPKLLLCLIPQLIHPIGFFFMGAYLFSFFFCFCLKKENLRKVLEIGLISTAMISLYFLWHSLENPMTSLYHISPIAREDTLTGISENISKIFFDFRGSNFRGLLYYFLSLGLISVFLVSGRTKNSHDFKPHILFLWTISLFSFLYVVPSFPGELFFRVEPYLKLGTISILTVLVYQYIEDRPKTKFILIFYFGTLLWPNNIYQEIKIFSKQIHTRTVRHQMQLPNLRNLETIKDFINSEPVLFLDEIALLHFTSNICPNFNFGLLSTSPKPLEGRLNLYFLDLQFESPEALKNDDASNQAHSLVNKLKGRLKSVYSPQNQQIIGHEFLSRQGVTVLKIELLEEKIP
ncbi:MAG: hypothetical protein AB8E15_02690 [Bdellovibrionales bacterium]